jgi:hypothetical protein
VRIYQAAVRAAAIAAVVLLCFGAVLLREATSPSGEGYWTAMAAAPDGGLYVADEQRQRLVLVDASGAHLLGRTPPAIYRSLAQADGRLLLGTESGLFVSSDSGKSWRFAIPSRRITAVALGTDYWLAGAWNDGLYRSDDQGATWTRAVVPPGDLEFEQLVPGFAATLLGLLRSNDGGRTWDRLPGMAGRVTAVDLTGPYHVAGVPQVLSGDWYGRVWAYDALAGVYVYTTCQGGIWSISLPVVATTQGLCPKPRSGPALLADHEVTRVVRSGLTYYAAVARGAIYFSDDGSDWRFAYQPGH